MIVFSLQEMLGCKIHEKVHELKMWVKVIVFVNVFMESVIRNATTVTYNTIITKFII